jgi:hypothetical protein
LDWGTTVGNGRKAKAPCGHLGETIIGTYVQCLKCDKQAAPKYIPPEKTEPMRTPRCPTCRSMDIEEFEDDLDAAFFYINVKTMPSSSPMPPQAKEWGCHSCGMVFARPT